MHITERKIKQLHKTPFLTRYKSKPKLNRCSSVINLSAQAHHLVVITSEGLETPIQALYGGLLFSILLTFLGLFGNELIARRELDEAAKEVADRINSKNVAASDYFEMGAILTQKKSYVQALRYLQKSIKSWDGEEIELAQVYNAVGFVHGELGQISQAQYYLNKAVTIEPSYTSAWNNLGDIHERKGDYQKALCCYKEVLEFSGENTIAMTKITSCETKIRNLRLND